MKLRVPLTTLLYAGLLLVLASGCSESRRELRLIEPRLDIDRMIATEFANLLDETSSVSIRVVSSEDEGRSGIDALLLGDADLAFVSNNEAYAAGISAVMPMYQNVLHVIVRQDLAEQLEHTADRATTLASVTLFAGQHGSPSRVMMTRYLMNSGIKATDINYVEDLSGGCPQAIAVFAPVIPSTRQRLEACADGQRYRMFGMGTPGEIGTGLDADRAVLLDPNLRVFIIPAGTYGEFTPEPVVTVAVDKLLVVRSDIPEAVIYDLISEIIRLRPALSAIEPTIFHGIGDDFDASKSTFVMHPGSQSYIERNEPSIYERYSGIAEVGVTILLALLSGTIAATRIYSIRRKNRVDQFYADVIAIRKTINDDSSSEERRAAITSVRILQTRAFDLLMNEKLAADESFRIFVTLSNDIIDELKQSSAPDWSRST